MTSNPNQTEPAGYPDRSHPERAVWLRQMADIAPVMIWVCDVSQRYAWFNQTWLEFVGRSLEQELGDGWIESLHPDDVDQSLRTFRAAFDARQPLTREYRLRRCDGEY